MKRAKETHPRVHLQHRRLGKPRCGLQIIDTWLGSRVVDVANHGHHSDGIPLSLCNVVIYSMNLTQERNRQKLWNPEEF